MEQQFDTSKIGMWTFLATEVLMFGGLFVGFGLSQGKFPQEFVDAHHHLQRWAGALNTVVLLISSWTMVMAVNAAKTSDKAKMKMFLIATFVCACIFMGVKYYEYSHKFEEGLLPGRFYVSQVTDTLKACVDGAAGAYGPAGCTHGYATFFSFYFMMTGLHGIHILIGMGLILWLLKNADKFSAAYYTPVDLFGLYWHIVDMIWIYLFPLYYLIS
ncbi:MAG: cytochrome c oxidase subunit 3 family protein [Bryobacteraceae bacterium]